jgi:hypothetical protein
MKLARCTVLAAGLLVFLYVHEVQSQTNVTGSISGVVSTSEATSVEGAWVTATRLATGTERTIQTGSGGNFRFAALPVGEYQVLVEADGLQAAEHGPVIVTIGGASRLNVTLVEGEKAFELDKLTVVGGRISTIDVETVESTTIITDEIVNRLPVARDVNSVALLAPGTTLSPVFGLVGFGGASVAENAYYFNGMNMTNFYNGLQFTQPPFEFYQEFEVKTGGYGAEFGRSTGGVVNAVSKSGGDSFEFGAAVFWEPDELRETSPNVYNLNENGWYDYLQYTSPDDFTDSLKVQANASGPLVKDHLFFYALVEFSQTDSFENPGPSSVLGVDVLENIDESTDDTFWGLKLDWQINPNHLVEFTAFSDASTYVTSVDQLNFDTGELEFFGRVFQQSGGESYILRYTGYYGQALTVSVLAGQNKYDRTEHSDADHIPVAQDFREGYPPYPTDWLYFWTGTLGDERRMFRFDGEWDGGDHLLRFGLDYEENTTEQFRGISGGFWWTYFDAVPGTYFPPGGFIVPDGVTQIAREDISESGGGFEVINTALYIEDHWRVNDQWTLYAGIRNETFDNRNAVGETFVEMDDQWAPRLGFSCDVKGDLSGKLFGTAGRYFLPMPSRVNQLMAGALLRTREFFVLHDLNPDGTPIKGDLLASYILSDGTVPDVTELLDTDLKPTYQDEYILGYVWEVSPGWSLGVRGIYRDMKNAIEDSNFGQLLNEYALSNGYEDFYTDPLFTYVLTNPGTGASLRFDLDYDGDYEEVYFSGPETGIAKVRRTYKALEVFFERGWRNGWALQGSYTWSEAKGNYEGWTNSSTGQASGALMSSFDTPEIMEGAYGKLASDRPHTLKLFGAWDFAEHWQMSGNFLFQSGMAYGAYGCYPEPGVPSCDYFYDGDELVPRGSRGRSDDIYQLDLGLQFSLPIGSRDGFLYLRADVFNVFNSDTATQLDESTVRDNGERSLMYLSPNSFQQPRYVRLSARLVF